MERGSRVCDGVSPSHGWIKEVGKMTECDFINMFWGIIGFAVFLYLGMFIVMWRETRPRKRKPGKSDPALEREFFNAMRKMSLPMASEWRETK